MSTGQAPPAEAAKPRALTSWIWLAVRLAVTVGAFAWVLSRVDLSAVAAAFARVSPLWFLVATVAMFVNLGVGTVRWRLLLAAYGAPHLPSHSFLYRLYLIGFFYNTWLPGGVGGDVVRGVASRAAFGESGATAGVAVVFVERVLGLVGLLSIVGIASLVSPIRGTEGAALYAAIGIALSAGAVIALAVGRSIARMMPQPLERFLSRLPSIQAAVPFALAILLSLVTQTGVALGGHIFVAALEPTVHVTSSLAIVPLAQATAYIPITAGGAGAREAAFQVMYSTVGVSTENATAIALMNWIVMLFCAGWGALLSVPETPPKPEAKPDVAAL